MASPRIRMCTSSDQEEKRAVTFAYVAPLKGILSSRDSSNRGIRFWGQNSTKSNFMPCSSSNAFCFDIAGIQSAQG